MLAAGLYTAAFVLLAWPWLSGTLTIPWDAKAQFEPEMQFLATSVARGDSPFWTPNRFRRLAADRRSAIADLFAAASRAGVA